MPPQIDLLPATSAEDGAVRDRLAVLVNAAYEVAEAGMWVPGTPRVTAAEIGELIRDEELLGLRADGELIGCVRAHALDERTWGLGMLAVDPDRQGGGGGRALVEAAEQRARESGARTMQLELLVPVHGGQASKARLRAWYAARGYAKVRQGGLEHDYPELVPRLAVPCVYEIWHKPLAAGAPARSTG